MPDYLTKSNEICTYCDVPGLVECVSGWILEYCPIKVVERCPQLLVAIEKQKQEQAQQEQKPTYKRKQKK